jgi:hypothetical protein
MNESLSPKPLKATLEAIRDMATNALSQIEQSLKQKFLSVTKCIEAEMLAVWHSRLLYKL